MVKNTILDITDIQLNGLSLVWKVVKVKTSKEESILIVWSKTIIDKIPFISKTMTIRDGRLTGLGRSFVFNNKTPILQGFYVNGEMNGMFIEGSLIDDGGYSFSVFKNNIREGELITFIK